MNRNNKESLLHRAADTVRNLKTHAAVGTAALLASPMMAFAAPDVTPITSKITIYVAAAVIIVLAFAAGVWGLRAAGLMGKR